MTYEHPQAADNRSMFNKVARQYDLLNWLMSFGLHRFWQKWAIREVYTKQPGSYLDLGCGTGDMSVGIMNQSHKNKVFAVDPAQNMLDILKNKAKEPVHILQASGTELPFPDQYFDGIISTYTLRNFPDVLQVLTESHRVIKQEGTVVLMELTRPGIRWLSFLHKLYLNTWVRLIGALISSPEAYKYLSNSIRSFITPTQVVSLLKQAGFSKVTTYELHAGIATVFVAKIK